MANPKAQSDNLGTEWTTVSEELPELTKFNFEIVGEEFIGVLQGVKTLRNSNGEYRQFLFVGQDGEPYFINAGYALEQGMAKVRNGSLVRITYTGDRDTGQDSPMRLFRVDIGRGPKPTANPKPSTAEPTEPPF